ncbi:hypothetical protein T492DRAFT_850386 [Pavlovales sp. CCMP2436]|nr:hypothetical protein T492DRAFT_850386 [Pavlovales sp. CCMP2436]
MQFERAQASLTTALMLSMAFFIIELFGFWSGLTMFLHTHNFMHVIFHVAGYIAIFIFIVEGSHCSGYTSPYSTHCLDSSSSCASFPARSCESSGLPNKPEAS